MKNIVLIGMPGAGKSSVGVVLAKRMGFSFLDSDLLIQEREGMLLHEIMEKKGLGSFKEIENQVNASIVAERAVIATGGSAVYGREAMEHLQSIGQMVYLQLPCDELVERLGDLHQRGVAMEEGQSLVSLYKERCPLYEKYAEVTVQCGGKQIREIIDEIVWRIQYDK